MRHRLRLFDVLLGFVCVLNMGCRPAESPEPAKVEKRIVFEPKKFLVPEGGSDQYGNPVRTDSGKDGGTDLPGEIWMKEPRIEFVLVPAGEFLMGSPEDEEYRGRDEGPQVEVVISRPFYISKYEITQKQWTSVMGENPSHFAHAGEHAPVENVSWNQSAAFCGKMGLRLPKEPEWEYACRSGTTSPIYSGQPRYVTLFDSADLDAIAWWGGNSRVEYAGSERAIALELRRHKHDAAGTNQVGSKSPNAWGLYDMLGNVAEWCDDTYHPTLVPQSRPRAPEPDTGGNGASVRKVLRGGHWASPVGECRSASRGFGGIDQRAMIYGLRPVLDISFPGKKE